MHDWLKGSADDLTVTITSSTELDTQVVELSFDRTVWITAAWLGTAATTRDASILLTPELTPAVGWHPIYARVTEDPEIHYIDCGTLQVR
jgi:hypothetical protein